MSEELSCKRGQIALDVLDDLKVGLLGGDVDPSMLMRMKMATSTLAANSREPEPDAVLADIGLRLPGRNRKTAPRQKSA